MKNHLLIMTASLIVSIAFLTIAVQSIHTEAKYPFIQYCQYYKYPVEQHFVKTEDGYILKMFRIQKKNT